MFLNVFLLLNSLLLVNAELICRDNENSAVLHYCPEEHHCCPEGCCLQNFAIPRVSIALGLNICTFILVLCFLCWTIQYFVTLCRKFGILKPKTDEQACGERRGAETPPPAYSVAVNLSNGLPTYDDTKGLVK